MFKSHLEKISRTSSRLHNRKNFLRLDKNERVIPFDQKTIKSIQKLVTNDILQIYPENFDKTLTYISRKEKIDKKFINLVPGADSGIKYLFEVLSYKKKVISIFPTYGMIEVFAKVYKQELKKVFENEVELKFLNKSYYNDVSFIYIANPNQPSGAIINNKKLIKIIELAKKLKKYIIVDEAYIDFSSQRSLATYVKKYKNLIILKSMSKSIGIAGLRIGYIIADSKINKMINAVRSAGDISSFSLGVLDYFIRRPILWKQYQKEILLSKKLIEIECKKRRLKYRMTEGNFFYIFFKERFYKKIFLKLKKNKILVKLIIKKNKYNLRITIGSIIQMKKLFRILDKK